MDTEMPNNTECDKCKSNRLLEVYVQGRDCHSLRYKGKDWDNYMPKGLGLYGNFGDAIQFMMCLECGKVQGDFPKSEDRVQEIFNEENES